MPAPNRMCRLQAAAPGAHAVVLGLWEVLEGSSMRPLRHRPCSSRVQVLSRVVEPGPLQMCSGMTGTPLCSWSHVRDEQWVPVGLVDESLIGSCVVRSQEFEKLEGKPFVVVYLNADAPFRPLPDTVQLPLRSSGSNFM